MASPPLAAGHNRPGKAFMALIAVAFPILPGKTKEWQDFIAQLNGPRRAEFVASRERVGAQERTYLQQTPMGDLVIVTLEGDDPAKSNGRRRSTALTFRCRCRSLPASSSTAARRYSRSSFGCGLRRGRQNSAPGPSIRIGG